MTLETKIQLFATISALLIGLISIIISVLTLHKNSQMIENSTRPYLSFFAETVNFSSPKLYIILKNFGNSSAIITDIKCSSISYDFNRFKTLINHSIAPKQSFSFPILPNTEIPDNITFYITYQSNVKKYSDEISLNMTFLKNKPSCKIYNTGDTVEKELRTISYTLQELVTRNL